MPNCSQEGEFVQKWYLSPSVNCMIFCWPLDQGAFAGFQKEKKTLTIVWQMGCPGVRSEWEGGAGHAWNWRSHDYSNII